jgi:5-methyltetrahydrofolate--homocysteine methyltransferase
MRTAFLDALHSGRVLLMDGAMGTELQRAGIQPDTCYEHWNLTHAERVTAIHQSYVDAGADVILSNTFQANASAFAKHKLQLQLDAICRAGVDIARAVAGPRRFVLGDIGPESSVSMLNPAVTPLLTADALFLETASDSTFVNPVTKHVSPPQIPIMLSVTYHHTSDRGIRTIYKQSPEAVALDVGRHCRSLAALGVNCGRDITMDDCIEIIRRYRSVTDLPLFARPNAGTPTQVDGQWIYPHTPEIMAAKLPELLEAGVAMVGGCCGTTPPHIAAFRTIVDRFNAQKK